MTDPRITLPPTKPADTPAPLTRGEVALKIISTTGDLQSVRRPMRLQGDVTAISKDGTSATIATAKGDVTVQLKPNTPIQQGQPIEIDIPAGNPPRQAVVRAAPDAAPQQPTTSQPTTGSPQPPATPLPSTPTTPSTTTPQTPASSPPTQQTPTTATPSTPQQPPPTGAQTPAQTLPPELRSTLDQLFTPLPGATAKPAAIQPAPLPLDAIVRLIPLPGFPPMDQLLPFPTASQALIDILKQKITLLSIPQDPLPDDAAAPVPQQPTTIPTTPKPMQAATLQPAPTAGAPPLDDLAPPLPGPFDARIVAIKPDALLHPETLGPPKISLLTAQPLPVADVVATTRADFPVLSLLLPGLKTPLPVLLQFPAANLPPGTQIELAPLPLAVPGQPAPSTAPTPPATLLSGWTWPVLDDTLQALSQMMPQAHMAQTMASVMPSPARPAVMNASIAFFIAAIQSGDMASWLGDKAISALRRDAARGGDVLSRLARDIDGLTRMMDAPVAQDWKGLALPLYWQNEIQKMHLFYRKEQDDQDSDNPGGETGTRFLFDLNLSKMGDLQIDGLMKAKRLDIILRTAQPFSHAMQTALREKYLNVLDSGHLTGDLAFQNRLDQWVRVKVDTKHANWGQSV